MRSKILMLALISLFIFSASACASDVKYAIIKIPTDPERIEKGEKVDIYFTDAKGERIDGEDEAVDKWPLQVDRNVRFLDNAVWYISNPICVWYDRRRI